jgi:hypothetical protein
MGTVKTHTALLAARCTYGYQGSAPTACMTHTDPAITPAPNHHNTERKKTFLYQVCYTTESLNTDTPGNTFTTEESGIQTNNKPEFEITEKGYQIFHVETSGEKSKDITVMAIGNAAGKFLLLF